MIHVVDSYTYACVWRKRPGLAGFPAINKLTLMNHRLLSSKIDLWSKALKKWVECHFLSQVFLPSICVVKELPPFLFVFEPSTYTSIILSRSFLPALTNLLHIGTSHRTVKSAERLPNSSTMQVLVRDMITSCIISRLLSTTELGSQSGVPDIWNCGVEQYARYSRKYLHSNRR